MFEKAKELLRAFIDNGNVPQEDRQEFQALLRHLENEERMKELCKLGYFVMVKGRNAWHVDFIVVSFVGSAGHANEVIGNSYPEALDMAIGGLEGR